VRRTAGSSTEAQEPGIRGTLICGGNWKAGSAGGASGLRVLFSESLRVGPDTEELEFTGWRLEDLLDCGVSVTEETNGSRCDGWGDGSVGVDACGGCVGLLKYDGVIERGEMETPGTGGVGGSEVGDKRVRFRTIAYDERARCTERSYGRVPAMFWRKRV
jgi:hypothetical protein